DDVRALRRAPGALRGAGAGRGAAAGGVMPRARDAALGGAGRAQEGRVESRSSARFFRRGRSRAGRAAAARLPDPVDVTDSSGRLPRMSPACRGGGAVDDGYGYFRLTATPAPAGPPR